LNWGKWGGRKKDEVPPGKSPFPFRWRGGKRDCLVFAECLRKKKQFLSSLPLPSSRKRKEWGSGKKTRQGGKKYFPPFCISYLSLEKSGSYSRKEERKKIGVIGSFELFTAREGKRGRGGLIGERPEIERGKKRKKCQVAQYFHSTLPRRRKEKKKGKQTEHPRRREGESLIYRFLPPIIDPKRKECRDISLIPGKGEGKVLICIQLFPSFLNVKGGRGKKRLKVE